MASASVEAPVLDSNVESLPVEVSDGLNTGFPQFDAANRQDDHSHDLRLLRLHAVNRSWMQLSQQPLRQFWETGFWEQIFDDGQGETPLLSSLTRPAFVPDPVVSSADAVSQSKVVLARKRARATSFLEVVSSSTVQSWQEQRDATWETAIRRWHSCIMSWKGTDNLIGLVQAGSEFQSQCQIIVDVLHNKAPSTLLKRCNSISRLVNDLLGRGLDFPCSENDLYEHMCRERSARVKLSRLKSLMEAVTFVRHVFNIASLEGATKSRRCMGVATAKQPTIVHQAPPLRVSHLLALHFILDCSDDAWNVCFCGMVLFCVYGRARWSDAQHSQSVLWDEDTEGEIQFVECSTAVHKTCRALSMRHMFLPLTAPAHGVSRGNWAQRWKWARGELGVEDLNNFPFMPAPGEDLKPTARPLSTAEAARWLIMLLEQYRDEQGGPEPLAYTSHSFKATCLSYLAKMGCDFNDRLALGYHVNHISMALRYSRDGASRPLRVLEDCLRNIREGSFRPDETRSGRFVSVPLREPESPEVVEQKVETIDVGSDAATEGQADALEVAEDQVAVDSASDHVTTSSSGSESSDENNVVLPKVPYRRTPIPEGTDVWRHLKLRTVHLAPKGYKRILHCGRKITDRYRLDSVDPRFDFIKCKQCFANQAKMSA